MDLMKELLQLEERFWKGNADFFRKNLTPGCIMIFEDPIGILTKEEVVTHVADGPRWDAVRFRDVHVVQLTGEVALLIYKATARRDSGYAEYVTLAASTYQYREDSWKLALHQQTPADDI